ncbi:MAG: AraC family transcriptional regulator ligand-binding domain-containing protein [Moraxellaceae bacterium]
MSVAEVSLLERAGLKALDQAGVPASAVLALQGRLLAALPVEQRDADAVQQAFWAALVQVTANADAGLWLSQFLPSLRGHVIEYFFSSSRTFGGALLRMLSYQKLLNPTLAMRLVMSTEACFLADEATQASPRHLVECFVGGLVRFLRDVSDNGFLPLQIHFCHTEGASPEYYQQIYGCPVLLGQAQTRLYFDAALLGHESWQADISLQGQHEKIAEEKLEEVGRQELVHQVRRVISQTLEGGDFGIDAIAARLCMTRRRLQLELAAVETSYNDILEDYRRDLAERLLQTTQSIEDIAYLVGFSDPSAFYRAFRRWTGMTPLRYRDRYRDQLVETN